ncbi:MAG: YqgE/AlgH family protein [Pseudomonadota bacterium]
MTTDLTGKLLIAMPSIGDQRFSRSVILVCAHNEDYAMGIVVNKPFGDLSIPELLEQLDIPMDSDLPSGTILDGGPVGSDRGFVLHSSDFCCAEATLAIQSDLCLTATREVLHAIASDDRPRNWTLALGYSGWGPGQLELELKENAWLVGEPDWEILFGRDFETKWQRALKGIGVSSGRLQAAPGRA